MAGSQLKKLKATLKEHGLTGQANIKKNKKNTKRKATEYDREEKVRVINKIREQFNPFEVKATRDKRNEKSKDKNNTSNRVAVGKPGISKQIGEEQRKQSYEARKLIQNKRGGLVDRRFGERDKNLTEEEKMLERFTRERQSQSKKKQNLYNLEDDENVYGDDDDINPFDITLTHGGVALATETGFLDEDNGLPLNKRAGLYDDSADGSALGQSGPARKKTKTEVMKEVIAKSKHYKQERQKTQAALEDKIDDLDENFDDIMSALMPTQTKPKSIQPKSNIDIEYDTKFRELNSDQRAVPSDRTKTEEELKNEAEEKKKKLEQQRLDRMKGMVENEDGEEHGVEDLDDGFWSNDDENENMEDELANSDDDVNFDTDKNETDADENDRITKKVQSFNCPTTHDELLNVLESYSFKEHPIVIKKIIKLYQPKLAEGNKERLGKLTGILLRHIMFIAGQDYSSFIKDFEAVTNSLVAILKTLSEKYNQSLSEEARNILIEIQERFKLHHFAGLSNSDLIFFIITGTIFSTSDMYHLVATPSALLISEILEQMKYNTVDKVAYGAILAQISLKYQRISKRFVPELLYFFEKSLSACLDSKTMKIENGLTFSKDDKHILKLHIISHGNDTKDTKFQKTLILNLLNSLETAISTIWKELSAFPEICIPIKNVLQSLLTRFPSLNITSQLIEKIERLMKFNEHVPLTMQNHKPMAIPSHAPKFEENFNPNKKSYDPDVRRNEINKMKAQLKKERKFTMKELRKDTRFEARQRIDEKKKDAEQYHAKMAHIYNTISTEEGAEKNKYERERKLRSGKK
ncbi:similar to Saccharomyces cerevisiae YDL148C NOP14 Nucleolar protein, forms a complex with Noc4p that mediates maturation and nuclear export of 40S ribosomal subunits [Maudiozyma barnettii]|uniref:Similar to Saccharomyces cerevisiae YDL148C NOP14 Nucleolar protein, forms a complex with Noc4p that mediates maturation and nuclear export of 40S ribosomal subunits n=1 Tax=Maudiozyma barnettii TaxID=61262 RepID=A0A8H2VBG3_9SACH|nr:snoRNA-binding rRNA-processing protein NOP14 [Kazachstania barnettii]CAB4252203.1 similar to Saccharomyces cerevisiae YDL148C NOP14 Nucleolar protein, forms a complex with Noc4p that mediates maturation and nuclear export of 40S ribosomal subunits [Kazachstania barnettii]CAD1778825.1 similar to Saccharomyces cerevisiae YDL148C NOP14 Nucleolar protein, forms a complex with Noc4p that mediates maturation and nuclear export of 40S ribosomal subunits [Kazachstania barnettii]